MKKVAFFTEINFNGKYPKDFPNARVDVAWQILLDADHYCIRTPNSWGVDIRYDVAIIILPKKSPLFDLSNIPADKLFIMQEGPNWYWQDWTISEQVRYLHLINSDLVTGLLCHNYTDTMYYSGLTRHPVYVFPSIIVDESIPINFRKPLPINERYGVLIGGNMVSWYGGMDSLMVAEVFQEGEIYAPSMGRKQPDEENIESVIYLPYLQWNEWMCRIRNFKYAVHLMRTHAAGTFALNCAYYGIPCIGYKGLLTQELCHPNLTVDIGDLDSAKKLAKHLRETPQFYEYNSILARENYLKSFTEMEWKNIEFFESYIY